MLCCEIIYFRGQKISWFLKLSVSVALDFLCTSILVFDIFVDINVHGSTDPQNPCKLVPHEIYLFHSSPLMYNGFALFS